jgi:hypothetical protein
MTELEEIRAALHAAAITGLYMGLLNTPQDKAYVDRCRQVDYRNGIVLLFTRDVGHHSNGWWKNPDFERCWHLSVSFFDPLTLEPRQFVAALAWRYAKLMFGADACWSWIEPPYSPAGKLRGVHHYRVFADEAWRPMKPRGEVYSKDFTEKGWKSFSEIHGDDAKNYVTPMGSIA